MRHQRFAAKNIRGFGLIQRDRDFADYQDLFNLLPAGAQRLGRAARPLGRGRTQPRRAEHPLRGSRQHRRVLGPEGKPQPLQPYRFAYTLYWTRETDLKLSPNRVLATRIGADPRDPQRRQFAHRFRRAQGSMRWRETPPPQAIASCSDNAAIVENQVFRNPIDNTWRVMLKLEPKPGNQAPVDLRCTLKKGDEVLSETWTYPWSPP